MEILAVILVVISLSKLLLCFSINSSSESVYEEFFKEHPNVSWKTKCKIEIAILVFDGLIGLFCACLIFFLL